MGTPLLGWIPPEQRTQEQQDAHAAAMSQTLRNHGLPPVKLDPGRKVLLTDSWKHPDVVQALGTTFTGFRQLSGSCVGVSGGNWRTTLACLQSLLQANPTLAFIDFWPFPYGMTRYNEGDRGQGEGAVDSVMGQTTAQNGFFDINTAPPSGIAALPKFDTSDGFALTQSLEYQWSDGGSKLVTNWASVAKQHVGVRATCNSTDDIWNAIGNGYPVIDGCDNYCGGGHVVGSGDTAYAVGVYDGRGGHSTCFLGIWQHPTAGRLFMYSNQWDGSTYPDDGSGKARCCVWMLESTVARLFQTGGSGGETMALSHVDWFPAQSKVLDWFI